MSASSLIGLLILIPAIYEMYGFEVQDNHETLKDVMKDARQSIKGKFIVGMIMVILSYFSTFITPKN